MQVILSVTVQMGALENVCQVTIIRTSVAVVRNTVRNVLFFASVPLCQYYEVLKCALQNHFTDGTQPKTRKV